MENKKLQVDKFKKPSEIKRLIDNYKEEKCYRKDKLCIACKNFLSCCVDWGFCKYHLTFIEDEGMCDLFDKCDCGKFKADRFIFLYQEFQYQYGKIKSFIYRIKNKIIKKEIKEWETYD